MQLNALHFDILRGATGEAVNLNNDGAFHHAIGELMAAGLVRQVPIGGRGWLTEKGEAALAEYKRNQE